MLLIFIYLKSLHELYYSLVYNSKNTRNDNVELNDQSESAKIPTKRGFFLIRSDQIGLG